MGIVNKRLAAAWNQDYLRHLIGLKLKPTIVLHALVLATCPARWDYIIDVPLMYPDARCRNPTLVVGIGDPAAVPEAHADKRESIR